MDGGDAVAGQRGKKLRMAMRSEVAGGGGEEELLSLTIMRVN